MILAAHGPVSVVLYGDPEGAVRFLCGFGFDFRLLRSFGRFDLLPGVVAAFDWM
eukprot:SAG31_NODE_6420_length_2026_cov_2.119875_1_plen_54_part_00